MPRAAAPASPPSTSGRAAYLVLGMHRSGTSAITQLLALAGAKLPANVMPGDEHNAKGYFEPWKIAQFDEDRLIAGGSAWDDPFAFPYRSTAAEADWSARAGALFDAEFGRARHPLMKDPRATVLMPMWRAVLDARGIAARCVIPVRHPLAVAGSLGRRDGFSPEKSVLVWSAYMLAAEAYTRDLPRVFVGYEALLSDWRGEARRIEAAHGAPLPGLTDAAGRKIDAFLTPDLRHNRAADGLSALGWTGEIAQAVLDACEAATRDERPSVQAFDAVAARLAERQAEIGALVSPQARDLAAARAELAAAREALAGAQLLEAELRADLDLTRRTLENGWRGDLARLEAARAAMDQASAELDRALVGD